MTPAERHHRHRILEHTPRVEVLQPPHPRGTLARDTRTGQRARTDPLRLGPRPMRRAPCSGIGETASVESYDSVTRTAVCPVCRAIKSADDWRRMDPHDVLFVIDFEDEEDDTTND